MVQNPYKRQRPPKPYKLLKFFISFVTAVKFRHALTIWKKLRWKLLCLPTQVKEYHGNHKNFKSLYGIGGRCLKITDVCMDFESYFKVHNLVTVHPKSVILGQITNPNMIFHVVVSLYQLIKIWNSSSLLNILKAKASYHLWRNRLSCCDIYVITGWT